jgi:hypothetical protein
MLQLPSIPERVVDQSVRLVECTIPADVTVDAWRKGGRTRPCADADGDGDGDGGQHVALVHRLPVQWPQYPALLAA